MSNPIQFTRNYRDLSTDKGFQFEFFCDRCGSGFRTHFQTSVTGAVSGLLDSAGSIFGGIFGSAATVGHSVRSAGWEKGSDEAFVKAVEEITPEFFKCPRCSKWVCRTGCHNEKKGLCKDCAPDLGVEMAAAQASKSVEEIWAHAAMAEEDKKLSTEVWREGVRATCPQCEAPLVENSKFCPSCGASVKAAHCTQCGAKLPANAKFCGECGTKTGAA
jgi:hypothetical protein